MMEMEESGQFWNILGDRTHLLIITMIFVPKTLIQWNRARGEMEKT